MSLATTNQVPTLSPNLEPVVVFEGVGKRFDSEPPVDALKDVDLTIQGGDWVAIQGPSGSGKSTLLNIMGCLDRHTSGTYRLGGVDTASLNEKERAAVRAHNVGFVFQAFHLLGHRTVMENVMLAEVYLKKGPHGRADRAREALVKVGLEHRMEFLPTRLSGGERQRVAIARALVGTPRFLLCDEPTGNLDSHTTASILELLQDLNDAGLTIVMITHESDVAARAKRRIHIIDGELTEGAA